MRQTSPSRTDPSNDSGCNQANFPILSFTREYDLNNVDNSLGKGKSDSVSESNFSQTQPRKIKSHVMCPEGFILTSTNPHHLVNDLDEERSVLSSNLNKELLTDEPLAVQQEPEEEEVHLKCIKKEKAIIVLQKCNKKKISEFDAMNFSNEAEPEEPLHCNCERSKCLRLYCRCFQARKACGPLCKCNDCENLEENKSVVEFRATELRARNPKAFAARVSPAKSGSLINTVGCNCRKTGCQKKYCECFNSGIRCNQLCKCQNCRNEKVSIEEIDQVNCPKKKIRKEEVSSITETRDRTHRIHIIPNNL